MKKFLIAAAAMLLSMGMFAQSNPTLYVKAGLGLDSFTGKDVEDAKYLTGFSAVVGFEQPLTEAFVFGAELGAQTRGMKNTYDKYTVKTVFYDLTISPFVGYHFAAGTLDIEPHVGLVASYDLSGRIKDDDDSHKIDFDEDLGDDFQRLGVAVNPGVTAWFGQFGVDLTWQRGLLAIDKDIKGYDNQFLVRFAYRF